MQSWHKWPQERRTTLICRRYQVIDFASVGMNASSAGYEFRLLLKRVYINSIVREEGGETTTTKTKEKRKRIKIGSLCLRVTNVTPLIVQECSVEPIFKKAIPQAS